MLQPLELPITIRKHPKDFYRTYLNLIVAATDNKLSDLEKDILEECFNYCEGEFDAPGRKIICDRLGISISNLNNYIGKLKQKLYIDEDNVLSKKLNLKFLKVPVDSPDPFAKIIFIMTKPTVLPVSNSHQ